MGSAAGVVAAVARPDTACIVVDHDRLGGLVGQGLLERIRSLRRPAPILALGCPDAASCAKALTSGATLVARADASREELNALLRCCLQARDLGDLVIHDDLTAAFNRRYFEERLAHGLAEARRSGAPLSLIFMDLDNLKAINVRHGHSTGSNVLRQVATRLIDLVRATDGVMRYGGDEFCIVLPGLSAPDAHDVAERIREGLAAAPFRVDDEGTESVQLTASFGIATYPDHAADGAALVSAADRAMLRIKDRQRNGILVADAP